MLCLFMIDKFLRLLLVKFFISCLVQSNHLMQILFLYVWPVQIGTDDQRDLWSYILFNYKVILQNLPYAFLMNHHFSIYWFFFCFGVEMLGGCRRIAGITDCLILDKSLWSRATLSSSQSPINWHLGFIWLKQVHLLFCYFLLFLQLIGVEFATFFFFSIISLAFL